MLSILEIHDLFIDQYKWKLENIKRYEAIGDMRSADCVGFAKEELEHWFMTIFGEKISEANYICGKNKGESHGNKNSEQMGKHIV